MEYYFIYMAAAVGLTVPHSIWTIFVHFFVCKGSYLGNNITNFSLHILFIWFAGITLFFNGALQKIIQRSQVAASKRSIDFTISVN